MNLTLWIIAGVLAVAFAAIGAMNVVVPKDKLVKSGQGWAVAVSPTTIRLIGTAEILAAIGLILPAVVPIFVPLAAIGLALVMIGAAVVRAHSLLGAGAVLLTLALIVAWERFGPYFFTS